MTIGVITIQRTPSSFGGSLQSYALWRFLKDQGYDVEIIDLLRPCHKGYKNSTESVSFHTAKKSVQPSFISQFKHFLHSGYWIAQRKGLKRDQMFFDFADKAKYSRIFESVDSLYNDVPDYDIYISGSDQIWNMDMPFEMAPYMLDFVKSGKKISYASSFGVGSIPVSLQGKVKEALSKYAHLGVRESSAAELLKSMGLNSEVVIDPTLLLSSDIWRSLSVPFHGSDDALFYFTLYPSQEFNSSVEKLSDSVKARIVGKSDQYNSYGGSSINMSYESPSHWLDMVEKSKFVVTDSFHATVFSIIFKKPFISLISNTPTSIKRKARIVDLLESLGLADRILYSKDVDSLDERMLMPIDYDAVYKKLNVMIDNSKDYLINAIKK